MKFRISRGRGRGGHCGGAAAAAGTAAAGGSVAATSCHVHVPSGHLFAVLMPDRGVAAAVA